MSFLCSVVGVAVAVTREQVRSAVAGAFRVARPTREQLLEAAVRSGAHPEVIEALRTVPDRRFAGVRDVWAAVSDGQGR